MKRISQRSNNKSKSSSLGGMRRVRKAPEIGWEQRSHAKIAVEVMIPDNEKQMQEKDYFGKPICHIFHLPDHNLQMRR